ncbi:MAG: hypothetical protein IKU23_00235 [Clostridia bacterium]|nr:hypothetical protein [Clostridia bacterium]
MKKVLLAVLCTMLLSTLFSAVVASANDARSSTVGAYTPDKCDYCNGNGTTTKSNSCTQCYGSGAIKSGCSKCGGDGYDGYYTETQSCSTCRGTGRTTKTEYTSRTCSSCSGAGSWRRCGICGIELNSYQSKCYYCTYGVTQHVTCSSCNGKGTRYEATGTTTVDCPTCSGDGYREVSVSKKCTSCSGKGYFSNTCGNCTNGYVTTSQKCSTCSGFGVKAHTIGDIDGRSGVTDGDAVHLFYHTVTPGDYTLNQYCDFNGDGTVSEKDATHLLYHTFLPDLYPIN